MTLMDQSRALLLAAEGFELWQEGHLEEADARYRAALAVADIRHYRTPDIHGAYAGLLRSMKRLSESGAHCEEALRLELENDPNEASPAVLTARYFLGEHYLTMGDPESARRVVAPSLLVAQKPLAWLVEAEALFLAGATAEACVAADRAISLAANPDQRERIVSRLSKVHGDSGPR
jgi:tetratricopeptide (TPR) repeat protein